MILKVNATRMELSRLKKELGIAISGHKLLKDKRDEMMRQFINIKKEATELRRSLGHKISKASKLFGFAYAASGEEEFKNSFLSSDSQSLKINKNSKNIMNVSVPQYSPVTIIQPVISQYTTRDFIEGADIMQTISPELIKLAELEMSIKLLSSELEKTRRHVNSLEYVTIPNYQETIRYIRMHIEETTRSNTARLIKVKDMVLEEKLSKKK